MGSRAARPGRPQSSAAGRRARDHSGSRRRRRAHRPDSDSVRPGREPRQRLRRCSLIGPDRPGRHADRDSLSVGHVLATLTKTPINGRIRTLWRSRPGSVPGGRARRCSGPRLPKVHLPECACPSAREGVRGGARASSLTRQPGWGGWWRPTVDGASDDRARARRAGASPGPPHRRDPPRAGPGRGTLNGCI